MIVDVCAHLPDRLTAFFGYPADFSSSWPLIVLLAAGMPLIGLDMVIGAALIAHDRQRAWTMVGIATERLAAVNIPWPSSGSGVANMWCTQTPNAMKAVPSSESTRAG